MPLTTAERRAGRPGGSVSAGSVIASVAPAASCARLVITIPRAASVNVSPGPMAAFSHCVALATPTGCMSISAVSESPR